MFRWWKRWRRRRARQPDVTRPAPAPEVGIEAWIRARGLRAVLDDPDPAVAGAAEEYVRTATGQRLSTLWLAHAGHPRVREILLDDPRRVPDDVVDAAWSLWLSTPDRRLWEKLDGRPATGGTARQPSRILLGLATPAETCAAALSGGSSDLLVAHAVAICRDRGYAPDDPVARAALFALTGQVARYREVDPDSALLARAYQRAPQRLRRRLRAAMSEVEGIHLVPVVGGDGRRALTETEREYLVRTLTNRRAWEELWRLALLLPLAHAIGVARRFDGWRPVEERDRALFDRLLAVKDRDLRSLPPPARALFERQPHLLRKAIPRYLEQTDPVLVDLLRTRLAHGQGEGASV
ncbi:hypothetical protein RB614_14170 [Phytohabitans sp. ZYX-F-186]|uniref:Uncharacterized protein n=1 Tax=Phytohabitans maris TaxID=3071409 RepID=A0ABU0ZHA4_9ACTN|nr:hypothetical protein [Phytohabitans sp. ZYX-F-186]MDQ7905660.1 hypothetical protein [Phytohabitans sp. ZYX-F-186]